MPKNLKRYYGLGHLHFMTFSCYRRCALLGTVRARNAFVRALNEVRAKYDFALVGYVVMPEHVHLLIGEPRSGTPSTVVHSLKLRVSNVHSAKKRREKLDYMHRNPVTRRLVKDPKDWVWSSYASYAGRGVPLLAIHFVD